MPSSFSHHPRDSTGTSSSCGASGSRTHRALRRSLHAVPSDSFSVLRGKVSSASSVLSLYNNIKATSPVKHHNQFGRRFSSSTPTTLDSSTPPASGSDPSGSATGAPPASSLKRLPRRPRVLRSGAGATAPAARATSPDPWLRPDPRGDNDSASREALASVSRRDEEGEEPLPRPREATAASAAARHHEDVLASAASECEQLVAQLRQDTAAGAPAGGDRGAREHAQERLATALGCLLDITRRPLLAEALGRIGASASESHPGRHASASLAVHRAFVALLSASVKSLRLSVGAAAAKAGSQQAGESTTVLLEHVVQVARQAHRLDLPLQLPWYHELVGAAANLLVADDTTSSSGSSASATSLGSGNRTASTVSLLLEIADWHASATPKTTVVSPDSSQLASMKLRFLLPVITRWMEQGRHDAVRETVRALLFPRDNLEGVEDGGDQRPVLDVDAVLGLLAALSDFPGDGADDERAVRSMLEPSALSFFRANRDLLRSHPQARALLGRCLLPGLQQQRLLDFYDPDDPDAVWDPFVSRVFLESGGESGVASLEDRLSALSRLYAHLEAAIDAGLIHVAHVRGDDLAGDTSSDEDDEEAEIDDSDWSSDDSDYDGEDEEDDVQGNEGAGPLDRARGRRRRRNDAAADDLAMRRHELYLRGRGRVLDASYLPDVTWQAMQLHRGLNLRFTDEYEEWVWKRDFPEDEYDDDDDDDLSLMTLHDSDDDPYSSGDDDGDGGGY